MRWRGRYSLPLKYQIPLLVVGLWIHQGSLERTFDLIFEAGLLYFVPVAVLFYVIFSGVRKLNNKRKVETEQVLDQLQEDPQWKKDYLLRAACESFKGVMAFKNKNDLEGLRFYLHPKLVDKWKSSFREYLESYKYADIEIIHCEIKNVRDFAGRENDTCTVAFYGRWKKQTLRFVRISDVEEENFSEYWTFEWEKGKWMLRETSKTGAPYAVSVTTKAS